MNDNSSRPGNLVIIGLVINVWVIRHQSIEEANADILVQRYIKQRLIENISHF